MKSSSLPVLFLILQFGGFTWAKLQTGIIDIEYYYTANSDRDGDFVVSQLAAELHDPQYPNLKLLTLSFGGVTIKTDQSGRHSCHADGDICETSLIHYCLEIHYPSQVAEFLVCYFQHELYPVDLRGASQSCAEKLVGANGWTEVSACVVEDGTILDYGDAVLRAQSLRPLFRQTPHVLLNEEYSNLAGIDLRKALCRQVESEDIWQCESVDKYKEPRVEVFYEAYEKEARDFFLDRFNQTDADLVASAALLLSIIPNPNKVLDCELSQPNCWTHRAHWCAHDSTAIAQLDFIHCSFRQQRHYRTAEEVVRGCLPADQYEQLIKPCIEDIAESTAVLTQLQTRLNALVDPSQQGSLEIIIRDQPNVKAKSVGLLEELCYNYFEVDDETLGCKVDRPKVQILYESDSPNLANVLFKHFQQNDRFSPFEAIMDIELIPYGRTTVDQEGNYHCPEGDNQCRANWIHACLIKNRFGTLQERHQVLQFVACTANYNETANPVDQAKDCLLKVYEDGAALVELLDDCAQKDDTLKEQVRNQTEAFAPLNSIPEIVVNGQKKTAEVGDQLLVALCRTFSPIKPRVCFEIDTASSQMLQVSVFLTGENATQTFVQSQIKPLLTVEPRDPNLRLRDVIEWQFVPWGPSQFNSTGSGEIECATGANECLVNRILSCATRQRQNGHWGAREDRLRVASFLVCFFDAPDWQSNPLNTANQCNGHLSTLDNYPQLWQCAVQDGKEELLLKMQKLTEQYPNISKFPSLAINTELQSDVANLSAVLCAKHQASPRPAECVAGSSGASAISVSSPIPLLALLCSLWLMLNR